jgi:hypothetical protein
MIPSLHAEGTPIHPVCTDSSNNVALPGCDKYYETNIDPIKNNLLTTVISRLVIYVGIAAIITLMVSGLYYLISLGNEEKTKKANKMIFYSIFGLVIAVFSYVIIQIVVNLQFS